MLEKKITPLKTFTLFLLIVAYLTIAGCIEEKTEYTMNPDFSGKATFDFTFTPFPFTSLKPEDTPEDVIKPTIERILKKSKGIDTWKDISFELTDNGFIHFIGTAYFPDINRMTFYRPEFQKAKSLEFTKDQSGRIIIELPNFPYSENKKKKKDDVKLSEEELNQRIRLTKLQYNQAKNMILATLSTLKIDSTLHLPAKIEKISNFEKINETTVRWKISGSEMIENLDKLMTDNERLKKLLIEGENPFTDTPDESIFLEILTGQKGPIQIVLSSDTKFLFDYESEVATAKKNYDKMIKELGLDKIKKRASKIPEKMPISSSLPAEPGTVIVGGVRLVRYEDRKREIRPLHRFEKDYTLSLILELPEPNLIVTKGQVEKAITDTGQDILIGHKKETSFPELSKDSKTAVFEVELSVPDDDAKGLAELSGTLGYLKSAGTKTIDLEIMDFKDGAKSKIEGFSIKSIGVSSWDKKLTIMNLKVDLLRSHLVSTKFYREDGTEIEVSSGGISFSGDELHDINYSTKGEFPPRGRIVFEVIDKITKHEIKFKLTNISLTGVQLKQIEKDDKSN